MAFEIRINKPTRLRLSRNVRAAASAGESVVIEAELTNERGGWSHELSSIHRMDRTSSWLCGSLKTRAA